MNSKTMIDKLPCGVFLTDSSYNIYFVNDSMLKLAGVTKAMTTRRGMSAFIFIRPDGGLMRPEDSDCLCKGSDKVIQRHLYLRRSDRVTVPVFISGIRILDSNIERIIFTVTDLTRLEGCDILPKTELVKKKFHNIVGESEPMRFLFRQIELAADSDVTIMINGESGTGKELVASAIHNESSRRNAPFIKVNCSSLVETLLESELFGHVKGSFTGAVSDRPGKFEAAEGGTLFLDEIGDISLSTQVKLLRVVQERVVTRVGENKERKVNIRLITATNKDIRSMVLTGSFREDLFFRLNVFPINTAPLRERGSDLFLITNSLVEKLNHKYGRFISGISRTAMQALMNYSWPGNVRELENALEYAFVLKRDGEITTAELPDEIFRKSGNLKTLPEIEPDNRYSRAPVDKIELESLLEKYRSSRKDVARHLGISTVALWKKMKKLGMLDKGE